MGLADRWADGDVIPVTLIFEKAGEIAPPSPDEMPNTR